MSEPVLQCRALCRSYEDGDHSVEVLNNVELRLEAGEKIAVVGSSGSGKSALIQEAFFLRCQDDDDDDDDDEKHEHDPGTTSSFTNTTTTIDEHPLEVCEYINIRRVAFGLF